MLVEALAELEGAAGGVVTNSGQSAALLALQLLPAGARVVAPHDCYGGTYRLIQGLEEQGKLSASSSTCATMPPWPPRWSETPALVWIETPSNPLLRIIDIANRAAEAKAAGALVVADNTLADPGPPAAARARLRPRPAFDDQGAERPCRPVRRRPARRRSGAGRAAAWWANAAGLNGSATTPARSCAACAPSPCASTGRKRARGRRRLARSRSGVREVFYPGSTPIPTRRSPTASNPAPAS